MKGLYWLVLGLCIWFVPFIIIEFIMIYLDPESTTSEVLSEIPIYAVFGLLIVALFFVIKGVITIRKERISMKEKKNEKKSKR